MSKGPFSRAQEQGRQTAFTALQLGVLPPQDNDEVSSTASMDNSFDEDRVSEMSMARAPSGIPTDIHLPELVFGEQIPTGTCHDRPPVLPFSTYAPCRLLDVKPDSPVSHVTFFERL